MNLRHVIFPPDISEEALLQQVAEINRDPKWHGLLIQLPLPDHINTQRVIEAVAPEKDVDCFHPFNVGPTGYWKACV